MGNTTGQAVNEGLYFILAFSVLLLVGITFFMLLFLVRYRKSRNPRATQIHGNPWVEVAALLLPTLLSLSFFAISLKGYEFLRRVPQGALQVAVHERQFAFSFVYPDGKKTSELVVPIGSDIRLNISSEDVIHGFYVPALRIQVDAVPGMPTYAWFHAGELGTYDILCTVYCGTGHSSMMSKLRILPVDQYEKWRSGEAADSGAGS